MQKKTNTRCVRVLEIKNGKKTRVMSGYLARSFTDDWMTTNRLIRGRERFTYVRMLWLVLVGVSLKVNI